MSYPYGFSFVGFNCFGEEYLNFVIRCKTNLFTDTKEYQRLLVCSQHKFLPQRMLG